MVPFDRLSQLREICNHLGLHREPLRLRGVVLGTLVMLLSGFISALPFASVSDWFLSTVVPLLILALPVVYLLGVWRHPVLYLIPTQGPLLLFAAVFVIAWVGQFVGHKIEGKKPSFLEDLQFLLIGPAWLMHFLYKKAGLSY